MDIDLQNIDMDIIDVEVELLQIPKEDLEEEQEFHGLVNLVTFPHQVKQYFERPNYFELYSENKFEECFRLSKDKPQKNIKKCVENSIQNMSKILSKMWKHSFKNMGNITFLFEQ